MQFLMVLDDCCDPAPPPWAPGCPVCGRSAAEWQRPRAEIEAEAQRLCTHCGQQATRGTRRLGALVEQHTPLPRPVAALVVGYLPVADRTRCASALRWNFLRAHRPSAAERRHQQMLQIFSKGRHTRLLTLLTKQYPLPYPSSFGS